jgi:hypothetical protein
MSVSIIENDCAIAFLNFSSLLHLALVFPTNTSLISTTENFPLQLLRVITRTNYKGVLTYMVAAAKLSNYDIMTAIISLI